MASSEPFNVETITVGELLAVEEASGKDSTKLLTTKLGRTVIVLFLQALRQHGNEPEWSGAREWALLANRRPSEGLSLQQPSEPDSASTT